MKLGGKHSPETRAKIAAKWQEPEYRARGLAHIKTLKPKRAGRPKGTKQPAEAIEKTRQANIKRWQDPEYRARHLPHLLALVPRGLAAARKVVRRVRPARGTPEFSKYELIRELLGPDVARSLTW